MNEDLPPDPPAGPDEKLSSLKGFFNVIVILAASTIGLAVLVFGTCLLLFR